MAAMGKRGMIRKETLKKSINTPAALAVNLLVSPVQIQPVATLDFAPSVPGMPIMREDFITQTGFLLSPRSPRQFSLLIKY